MKRNDHVAINYFIMRYEGRILNIISSITVEQTIYLLEIILWWWMACFKIEASLMGAFLSSSDTQSNSQLLLHFNRNWIPYFCQRARRVNPICKYLYPNDPQTITNSELSKNILAISHLLVIHLFSPAKTPSFAFFLSVQVHFQLQEFNKKECNTRFSYHHQTSAPPTTHLILCRIRNWILVTAVSSYDRQ